MQANVCANQAITLGIPLFTIYLWRLHNNMSSLLNNAVYFCFQPSDYFTFNHVSTIYCHIFKLPMGHPISKPCGYVNSPTPKKKKKNCIGLHLAVFIYLLFWTKPSQEVSEINIIMYLLFILFSWQDLARPRIVIHL